MDQESVVLELDPRSVHAAIRPRRGRGPRPACRRANSTASRIWSREAAGRDGTGKLGLFTKGGFTKALSNLKGAVWNQDAWDAYPSTTGGYIAGGVQGVATSPAAGMAGLSLAMSGLTGDRRGTWTGSMESAAGGALIGDQIGGPLGAAAGASFGFEVSMFEKLFGVESPENEAKRLVKQLYSISIDNSMAKQIVSLAQQKYAGHVSIAVRDPDVRKMLMLYSRGDRPEDASLGDHAAVGEPRGDGRAALSASDLRERHAVYVPKQPAGAGRLFRRGRTRRPARCRSS